MAVAQALSSGRAEPGQVVSSSRCRDAWVTWIPAPGALFNTLSTFHQHDCSNDSVRLSYAGAQWRTGSGEALLDRAWGCA